MTAVRLRLLTAVLLVVATTGVVAAGLRSTTPPEIQIARAAVIVTPEPVGAQPVVPVSVATEESVAPTSVPPTSTPATAAGSSPTTASTPAPAPTTTTTVAQPATTTTVPPAASPTSSAPASMTACERDLLDRMNEARASRGTAALVADGRIMPISRRWSDELADRQDLAHNPDYANQVFAARPEAVRAGENVGRTHGTNEGLFDAFMASDGHRRAILEPGHTHAGVGCTVDGGGQLWVTVNFWG